ncbi:hypothetical protein DFH94DRAFT_758935, partial [Russula ochroleuca]
MGNRAPPPSSTLLGFSACCYAHSLVFRTWQSVSRYSLVVYVTTIILPSIGQFCTVLPLTCISSNARVDGL